MIYSPKRKQTVTHILTMYKGTEIYRMLFEHGNELYMQKVSCSHSFDLRVLLCHVSNE
jgi:hypothetical protein